MYGKHWRSVSLAQSPQECAVLLPEAAQASARVPPTSRAAASRRETSQLCERLFYFRANALIPRVDAEWKPWPRLRTASLRQTRWSLPNLKTNPTFIHLITAVPVLWPLLTL